MHFSISPTLSIFVLYTAFFYTFFILFLYFFALFCLPLVLYTVADLDPEDTQTTIKIVRSLTRFQKSDRFFWIAILLENSNCGKGVPCEARLRWAALKQDEFIKRSSPQYSPTMQLGLLKLDKRRTLTSVMPKSLKSLPKESECHM